MHEVIKSTDADEDKPIYSQKKHTFQCHSATNPRQTGSGMNLSLSAKWLVMAQPKYET